MNLAQIKNIVWPIENRELKKFLPMAFFMFCVLFNYSMLRSIKDGLVVTGIGAEALSFLKLAFVLPSSILFFLIYTKASSSFSAQQLFYIITGFFAVYFLSFAFLLYPNIATLHPDPANIDYWAEKLPAIKWFILIGGKWIFASFYIIAELWGSVMLSFLFWWVANDITKTSEAKRFYPTFGLLGNIGLILTSVAAAKFISKNPEDAGTEFNVILLLLSLSCLAIMLTYRWINTNVMTDPNLYQKEEKTEKKKKAKLSVMESLKLILTSKYLGLIALLIFAYGVSIILIEGVWKNQIRQLYPTAAEYTAYMAEFMGFQGVATMIFMILGNNIIRLTSWRFAASLTPLMILATGIPFFAFIVYGKVIISNFAALAFINPIAIAVFIGLLQNVLSKSTKYSLFDPTKEMAYIPLDPELKSKGKVAVDVIGGRLGKSGGAVIPAILFTCGLNFTEATPYLAVICIIVLGLWLWTVQLLSKEYTKALDESK